MPESHHTRTLIGRSTEIETATAAVAKLRDGQGSVLLLSGEPGIGKSTLARLIARNSADAGLPVYWGFAWEAGGAPAYWPWTQLLRTLTAEQELVVPPILAQLLPEAATDEPKPSLPAGHAYFQLLESVRQLLETAARQSPLVLVLEDLHAADIDSLNLLQHIARHIASMPILLIGTFRELEARTQPRMEPLWLAARHARLIPLAQFSEGEVQEFLQRESGNAPSQTRAKQLFDVTAGNPLFLTELVGLLERSGSFRGQLPVNVQQVIRQQIELLPDATARQLTVASVLGREFSSSALCAIQNAGATAVSKALESGHEAGIIHLTGADTYRFAHALHRDVLYRDIDAADRQRLHFRYAEVVKGYIDAGDEDRWSTFATHLQAAGPAHRDAAVDAWRRAAKHAQLRVAFEDAAASLSTALEIFGEGPRYEPAERCRLLLAYAQALQLAGDIATGQQYCRDAFAIAETLQDAALMADAALTWGSTFVVAKVDAEMIAALQKSLAVTPDSDASTRAKIEARLAAALQPATDPTGPMEMARNAIALARSTGDETVIYVVLQSAISALMDFAPARERIELNREFARLAEKLGDIPGQFRSHLRLVIDASEIADRDLMDRAIDYCRNLARRIGLPHYQWRVASIRAMQATIEGRFADAQQLIESATKFAAEIDDTESMITLPMQRFLLLCEWDSTQTTPLADIRAQLREAYNKGTHAEFFVQPFVTALSPEDDRHSVQQLLDDHAWLDRTLTGGDRFSQAILGEMAIRNDRTDIAKRVVERLNPIASECSSTGLLGGGWCGPLAATLAVIQLGLGNTGAAEELLAVALERSQQMRSPPHIARCQALLAVTAEQRGDPVAAAQYRRKFTALQRELGLRTERRAPNPTTAVNAAAESPLVLHKDGDLWQVEFRGERAHLRDSKGLQMLAQLVTRPDEDIHSLDLSGATVARGDDNAGALLDDKARAAYQARIQGLNEALEEATEMADLGRADEIRAELEFITRELSRAFGLGGRKRTAGSAAERARVNARRRLKDAIGKISESAPATGRYLENTIKTGTYCRYSPI